MEANLYQLQKDHHAGMLEGVRYDWGGKPTLALPDAKTIPQIMEKFPQGADCSGWARELLFRATGGKVRLPEGSQEQWAYCKDTLKLHPVAYASTKPKDANDQTLYICFIKETKEHKGHVWFVAHGETFECYGGHGVGSRDRLARPLPQEVAAAYVVPHTWVDTSL